MTSHRTHHYYYIYCIIYLNISQIMHLPRKLLRKGYESQTTDNDTQCLVLYLYSRQVYCSLVGIALSEAAAKVTTRIYNEAICRIL